eukprot:s821_g8.t1
MGKRADKRDQYQQQWGTGSWDTRSPSRQGYWRGSQQGWERQQGRGRNGDHQFPSYDSNWKPAATDLVVVAESRTPGNRAAKTVLQVVQSAVNQVRKADARAARIKQEREEKERRWSAYAKEIQLAFLAEKKEYLAALERLDQDMTHAVQNQEAARAALGHAADGFMGRAPLPEATASDWDALVGLDAGLSGTYDRNMAMKDLQDIFGGCHQDFVAKTGPDAPGEGATRPSEDRHGAVEAPPLGPLRSYSVASPRVEPYQRSPGGTAKMEIESGHQGSGRMPEPRADPVLEANAGVRPLSRARTPLKQLPQHPVRGSDVSGPSLADKLHHARGAALAPFGRGPPLKDALPEGPKEPPGPAATVPEAKPPESAIDVETAEELHGAVSPGLGRME